MGRVAYLAHEELQDVLQRDKTQNLPRRVRDLREVRRGAAHHGQGVVQREFGAQGGHVSPQVLGNRPFGLLQVEYVLHMQIAHEGAVLRDHREPGVPGAGGERDDLAGVTEGRR